MFWALDIYKLLHEPIAMLKKEKKKKKKENAQL